MDRKIDMGDLNKISGEARPHQPLSSKGIALVSNDILLSGAKLSQRKGSSQKKHSLFMWEHDMVKKGTDHHNSDQTSENCSGGGTHMGCI